MVTKATNSVLNLVNPPIDEIHLVTPLDVSYGGTSRVVLPTGSVMIGNGQAAISLAPPSTAGTALLSNGTGVAPSFQAITPDIITGILPVTKGGTSRGAHTTGALLVGNNADAFLEVATANSNLGYPLISQGDNTAPAYANMNVNKLIGVLGVQTGGTGLSTIAVGAILTGAGTSAPTQTVLSAGSVVVSTGAGAVVGATPSTSGLPLISTGPGSTPAFNYLDASVIQNVLQLPHLPINVLHVYSVGTPGYIDGEARVFQYTVPSDHTYLYGEVVGGGGGGAACNISNPWSGGGGGGAGYAAGWMGPFNPGDVITITIGKGGRGGATYGLYDGEDGGTSSIGSYLTASGGTGGQVTGNVAGGNPGGGDGTAAAIVIFGSEGGSGCQSDSATQPGGHGGPSFFGGGSYSNQNILNTSTCAFGSGGGGAWGIPGTVGSKGFDGYVILRG